MLSRRAVRCPRCGARAGVPIRYGLPSPGMFDAAARGEIALGGCVIGPDDPNRRCTSCGYSWRRDMLGRRNTPSAGPMAPPPTLPELIGDGKYALACVGESHYVDALYDLGRAYDAEERPDRIEAEDAPLERLSAHHPRLPNRACLMVDIRSAETLAGG